MISRTTGLVRASRMLCGVPQSMRVVQRPLAALPARPPLGGGTPDSRSKRALVERLLQAKEVSGKSFTQIAKEIGVTNVYCAQLFYNQQQLKPGTAKALAQAVPDLPADALEEMQRAPMRRYDPEVLQEPAVYRLHEAITHGGEAIKAIINEEFGDGIMSAIGFYATIDRIKGLEGEDRVVITFNGKFLPYVEQRVEDNVAQREPGA